MDSIFSEYKHIKDENNIFNNMQVVNIPQYLNELLSTQQNIIANLNRLILFAQRQKEDFNNTALLNLNSLNDVTNDTLREFNSAKSENKLLSDQIETVFNEKKNNENLLQMMGGSTLERQFITLHKDLKGLEFLPSLENLSNIKNFPVKRKLDYEFKGPTNTHFCVSGSASISSLNLFALGEVFRILNEEEIVDALKDKKIDHTAVRPFDSRSDNDDLLFEENED